MTKGSGGWIYHFPIDFCMGH